MDVFFHYKSITDIPFYNCSALPKEELIRLNAIRRPLRGIVTFIVGVSMILVYIACLRVMVKLSLIRNSCYKIMFVIGHYEITSVMINDVFLGYSLVFGTSFCDAPNFFYIIGSIQVGCWAGASYLCLYLAFNRIMEAIKFRREVIDFFFSPFPTAVGISIGVCYSLLFLISTTPAIYSVEVATTIPNPLGLPIPPDFEMRNSLMMANNFGVVSVTCIFYGIFFVTMRKKFKQLGPSSSQNRLQNQVFIQCTLMCGFNFFISMCYASFLFLGEFMILAQMCYLVYQFTSGLQALIYLLCNQSIFDCVKRDISSFFGISKREKSTVITDMRTNKTSHTSSRREVNVISLPDIV